MKKLFSLMVFMLITSIMSTSCDKPEDPTVKTPPTEIKTPSDLEGTWEFQSFHTPDQGDITCPSTYMTLSVIISLKFTGSSCTITDKCTEKILGQDYAVTIVNNKITMMSTSQYSPPGRFDFTIKSFTYPTLVLIRNFFASSDSPAIITVLTLKKI